MQLRKGEASGLSGGPNLITLKSEAERRFSEDPGREVGGPPTAAAGVTGIAGKNSFHGLQERRLAPQPCSLQELHSANDLNKLGPG